MNDSETGAHVLLSPSQVPGDQAALCCTSLQANSATLAFDGASYENTGTTLGNGLNYEGAYALAGGKATRLSPAPASSPGNESYDTPVALTDDGRVVVQRDNCQNVDNMNVLPTCENALDVYPDTGGTAADWDYFGLANEPPGSFAGDPVDGGLLAYDNVVDDNTTSEDESDLLIADQSASNSTVVVVATQIAGEHPAWSPDGSHLVDDTPPPVPFSGDPNPAALWLFSASANQTGTELLYDPSSPTTRLTNAVFAGANEIVFVADDNLWWIPPSCDMCTFPGPEVHRLTTDGTAAAPDSDPSWTSQTVVPPPPPTKLKLTIAPASNQKVVKQKALVASFECNLICAFAAQGGVQINGSKKLLLTKELGGSVAAGRTDKLTLKLSGSELSKIKTALKKHKKVTAEVEVVVKDRAGAEKQSSKQFTVKH